MKTKLALILGIICIAVSAVTLFSVLSHADEGTITLLNTNGITASIKGISILDKNPRFIKLDVSPMKVPKVGEISSVIIEFVDDYDASIGLELLSKQKMNLATQYPAKTIAFVNADGQFVVNQPPQAAIVFVDEINVGLSSASANLQDLVAEQVRYRQLNEGIYVGGYGKMMWVWDGIRCKGKANENNSCHKEMPSAPK